jgi:hypothetical protein
MTGRGVERGFRAVRPSVSVPPTGVSTSLPPHIQGAERRTENRARHTGVRWGLRVLVVGGLAGVAWLLTGAAAQAADRADGPAGSLLGAVVDGDTVQPVTDLRTAAAQPPGAVRPAYQKHCQHHVVTDVVDVPRRVLSRPVAAVDELVRGHNRSLVDAVARDVDRVLREVAGPVRLTGGAEAPTVSPD